jgi:hypothetical protein
MNLEGTSCIEITLTSLTGLIYRNIFSLLDSSKYYLIAVHLKSGDLSAEGMKVKLNTDDVSVESSYHLDTTYVRQGFIIQPSDINTATYANLTLYGNGVSTEYGFVDAITLQEITAAEYALGADACMAKHPFSRNIGQTLPKEIISRVRIYLT